VALRRFASSAIVIRIVRSTVSSWLRGDPTMVLWMLGTASAIRATLFMIHFLVWRYGGPRKAEPYPRPRVYELLAGPAEDFWDPERAYRFQVLAQLCAAVALLTSLISGVEARFASFGALEEYRLVHMVLGFVLTQTTLHVSRQLHFPIVLPLQVWAIWAYQEGLGHTLATRFLTAVSVACFAGYSYWRADNAAEELFCARRVCERASVASEAERRRGELWQNAFSGMLDSLFDARCVCRADTVLRSSSPHLDELLGQSLLGQSFLAVAADEVERGRARAFLADLVASQSPQRIHLSLARRAADGRAAGTVDVVVSGIAVPDFAAQASDGVVLLVLGLQVVQAVEPLPLDAGEPASVWSAAQEAASVKALAPVAEGGDEHGSSVGDGEESLAAPSWRSAPAVFFPAPSRVASAGPCGGTGGDCLPDNATVWVEGQPLPAKAGDVASGQRVLCFDHLGGGLKYVDVEEAATHDASMSKWVEVALEDGTVVQTTVDHPVYLHRQAGAALGPGGSPSHLCVPAGELLPGLHSLEVFRLVPMPVREVRHLEASAIATEPALPASRVSLSVRQPERHSLFVAGAKVGANFGVGGSAGVAVASACLAGVAVADDGRKRRESASYHVSRTFVHVEDDDEEGSQGASGFRRRRSSSLTHRRAPRSTAGGRYSRLLTTPVADGSSGNRPAEAEARGELSNVLASSVSGSSYNGSSAASFAAGDDSDSVAVGTALTQRSTVGSGAGTLCNSVVLSSMMRARQQGLTSIGALAHHDHQCFPCLIQSRHQHGNGLPCKFGALCGRCHEDHGGKHHAILRSIKRSGHRARRQGEIED